MEAFTEFDMQASHCLKRLKNIANNYGEDQVRVIKCFLSVLFFREYIWKNERIGHPRGSDELAKSLEYPDSPLHSSQNINIHTELIRVIQDTLRVYSNVSASDDIIKNRGVIHDVFIIAKDTADFHNSNALYDYFFNHLFGEKVDRLVSSLINVLSGRDLKHEFVKEIPLLTGEVAIKGSKSLSIREQDNIDLYLCMRLYLHTVDIDKIGEPEFYFIRRVENAYFKQRRYYLPAKANAFDYFLDLSKERKFHAFVLGSARSYGSSLIELAHSGVLRAVIELPRAYNANVRNLYILDSYRENPPSIFFINSDKLYSLFKGNDTLLASFIIKLLSLGADNRLVEKMTYDDNDAKNYINRFFPHGYQDLQGLVYRASPDEFYTNKTMNVSRFVSSHVDEDLIFSPLDYAMIYHDITESDNVGGHYVIGNNGVGKSLLLRFLAEKLIKKNLRLLLVSFGLTDRFHLLKGKKGVVYLGDKQSEKHISILKRNKEILECIQNIFSNSVTHMFFNLVLEKLGFSGNIYCVPTSYTTSNKSSFDYSNICKMEDFIADDMDVANYLLAIQHVNNEQIVIFDDLSSGEQQLLSAQVNSSFYLCFQG